MLSGFACPPVFALQKQSPIFDWGDQRGGARRAKQSKGYKPTASPLFSHPLVPQSLIGLCFCNAKTGGTGRKTGGRPKQKRPEGVGKACPSPSPLHRRWREGPKIGGTKGEGPEGQSKKGKKKAKKEESLPLRAFLSPFPSFFAFFAYFFAKQKRRRGRLSIKDGGRRAKQKRPQPSPSTTTPYPFRGVSPQSLIGDKDGEKERGRREGPKIGEFRRSQSLIGERKEERAKQKSKLKQREEGIKKMQN